MTLIHCLLATALAMAAAPAVAERRGGTHRPSASIATYRVPQPHKRPRLHAVHSTDHRSSQIQRSLLTGL